MIKILVDVENFEDIVCNVTSKFEPAEDSTADEVLNLFVKAMTLEGYSPVSIIKALKEVSEDMIDTLETNEMYFRKFKDEEKHDEEIRKTEGVLCKNCEYCDKSLDSSTDYICHKEGRFYGDYVDLFDTCEYERYKELNKDDK